MPVKSEVKLPKLKPEKRRRRKLDVLNVEFNITEDSLTLFKPSVADVDPTQIHKNMCRWNVHEKSCAPFQLNKKDARQFYSYYINSLNEKTHLERNNFLEKEKKLGSCFCRRLVNERISEYPTIRTVSDYFWGFRVRCYVIKYISEPIRIRLSIRQIFDFQGLTHN